ncbi:MAG: hydantoinase B/oxoprolinase family protein [Solirubrobacterales bacterium]|nr:hydantoinase B/oxoprolinase family protein [Solirubrobacterales bacterium]
MTQQAQGTAEFDPVLSEIVYNYELTMNREMGRALVNLSGSFLFVSASDFACGCLDAEGNILTTISWSLQMGYAISNTVRHSLERFKDDLRPGDVIFANDPYEGGGLHSHDVVIVAPVFDGDEILMWVGVSAHVTDVGGAVPGGYSVEHSDVFGENVRFTPVKFYDGGKFRQDVLDAFLTNVRLPEATGIDLKAITGAVWMGKERCSAMIEQHGADRIRAIHSAQIENAATAFRERLSQLPDGVYRGAAHMEHDGEDDLIYTIRAAVIKRGDQLTVDYTGTDPQAPGVLNGTEVGAIGDAMAALGTVYAPDLPFNEGLLDPVTVVAPEGTLVNATKPAPISGATVYASWFGTDAILEASNYLLAGHPEAARRRSGPWGSWTFAWLQGPNQYGQPWFWNVFTGGSGGASAVQDRDGENAMMGIQTIDAFIPNVEEYESQSPVLFLDTRFAADTGGAGRHRGGLALESFCTPYDTEAWDVVVFHNRMSAPSSAIAGGQPGAGATIRFARGAMESVREHWDRGEELPVEEYAETAERPPARGRGFRVTPEDGYYIRATGGPGFGDPLIRDPEAVLEDVRRGFVTAEAAERNFGVVMAGDDIDPVATARLREERLAERRALPLGERALPVGDGSGGSAEPGPPVPQDGPQVLGEGLEIDERGYYRCRSCEHEFASNSVNWKWWAATEELPVSGDSIGAPIPERPEGDLVFRRYCCPGCGSQIDTEVANAGEAPRWNFMPLAVHEELPR